MVQNPIMAVKREVMQLHQVREPLANNSTPTISNANTQKNKQKKETSRSGAALKGISGHVDIPLYHVGCFTCQGTCFKYYLYFC